MLPLCRLSCIDNNGAYTTGRNMTMEHGRNIMMARGRNIRMARGRNIMMASGRNIVMENGRLSSVRWLVDGVAAGVRAGGVIVGV